MYKFEAGKTYYTRSIGDYECIFHETIAKRTDKTVTTATGKRFGISVWNDVEQFRPRGRYSMAAIISADKVQP